mmetsp:Transcript_129875/g.363487  ORF Transcript_129875/g.363487 Transcript_129875/m.363487 type:complete len:100 (-) Transcript_129875:161-460(-)
MWAADDDSVATEQFDMARQDTPHLSQAQWLMALRDRLGDSGLVYEDILATVDDTATFHAALGELGFSSALARMAIRKAVVQHLAVDADMPLSRWTPGHA